ncbi:MAG TPA: isoprenylcysteine carboxylmethyltransferase family protein [Bacillota bacterium]|nr:isoprenylcysteine carboxylmethyltransferase family protein [Bacillota bacterium]
MTEKNLVVETGMNQTQLLKTVMIRLILAIILLGAAFFIPAGTLGYWEAWVYMAVTIIPATITMLYLLRTAPDLLERRMRMREKKSEQKLIVFLTFPLFIAAFVLPGLGQRFGWTEIPATIIIIADLMVLLGYLFFIRVLLENRYASRVIEVEQKQKVITTGPYAVVRHPMYVSVLLIYTFSPVALGSLWGLIPMAFLTLLIIARIRNEEKVLSQELEGYREYMQKTKYRLIPGLW